VQFYNFTKNGVIDLNSQEIWSLFEKTGNIDVYMLYKDIEKKQPVVSGLKKEPANADTNIWNGHQGAGC